MVHAGAATRRLCVVGGGAAGVLFAMRILRDATTPVTITMLEPRAALGTGVAYASEVPHHIINVPASRMSADPDDAEDFTRWLAKHGDAPQGGERDAYARRALFGHYMEDRLAQARAASRHGHLVHQRCTAEAITRVDGQFRVDTAAGALAADAVVLATGNLPPALPAVLSGLAASPRCVVDPWRPDALAGLPQDARVLIVGTGLTMGDTVAGLRAAGHTGEIVALSRRGEIPRRGLAVPASPFGDFRTAPRTARGLIRLFRQEVAAARAAGTSWHAVLAAARAEAWALWAALPSGEQRRVNRHIRHVYELHRHVMPGPVHDLLAGERAAGRLRVVAARLRGARVAGSGLEVTIQPRGTPAGAATVSRFDAVVNCTGPAYAELTRLDPLWAKLAAEGLVRQDGIGIGPAVDRKGRAHNAAGAAQPDLLLVGTLARSAFGELTGVREIAMQARLAAEALLATWESDVAGARTGAEAVNHRVGAPG